MTSSGRCACDRKLHKQPFANALQSRCVWKFIKIHRKTLVPEFSFNKFLVSENLTLSFPIIFDRRNIILSCIHDSVRRKYGNTAVLKNFAIFTGNHLRWSLFLITLPSLRPATLLKTYSNTGDFL